MKKIIKSLEKVTLFAAIVFFMASCVTAANQKFVKKEQFKTYDAIIVPGLPFEDGEWGDLMKMRVYWSYYLYKKGIAKNIIYSGSAVYSPYVEAKIMALYAEKLGIDPEHIFVEPRAKHSTENLYYSYKIAEKNGFKKVALATDPFQSSFLNFFAKKTALNTEIGFIPLSFKKMKQIDLHTPEIDPSSAYVENFVSITEQENFATRFRGTMGKQIEYEEGDTPKLMRQKRRNMRRGIEDAQEEEKKKEDTASTIAVEEYKATATK